jgi:hypothetical protein
MPDPTRVHTLALIAAQFLARSQHYLSAVGVGAAPVAMNPDTREELESRAFHAAQRLLDNAKGFLNGTEDS